MYMYGQLFFWSLKREFLRFVEKYRLLFSEISGKHIVSYGYADWNNLYMAATSSQKLEKSKIQTTCVKFLQQPAVLYSD